MVNWIKEISFFLSFLILFSCQKDENFGRLTLLASMSSVLNVVSRIKKMTKSPLICRINDSSNVSKMYRVSIKGNIKKEVTNDVENYG